jgi:hypothetical protein
MTLPPFPVELVLSRPDLLNLRRGCCAALKLVPQAVLERWLRATADAVGGTVRVNGNHVVIDMLGIDAKGPTLNHAAAEWRRFCGFDA